MKVVIAFCLALGSALTVSRPYKPQGWRPIGQAFILPGKHERLKVKTTTEERVPEDYKKIALPNQEFLEASDQEISENHKDISKEEKNIEKFEKASESISAEERPITESSDLNTLALAELNDDSSVEVPAVKITETQLSNMADILHLISEEKREIDANESAEKRAKVDSGSLEGFFEYGLPLSHEYSPPKEPQDFVNKYNY